jgi:2-iminobutanoate/2-iminopropanoate deaminase|tara:strand:+ start:376 stop:570 length:195 start_codon:yes stop_codon:yes gene_type:complete
VLKAASFDFSDVIQVQAYLADLNDYKAMNDAYATYFSESKTTRAVVEAARITLDALVEIMMVAV